MKLWIVLLSIVGAVTIVFEAFVPAFKLRVHFGRKNKK